MMRNTLIASIVFVATGFIFSGIAAWMFYQQYSLEQTGIRVEGVVTGMVESSDNDGTTYAPIVQFSTPGGRTYEFQSDTYSSPPQYEIGERVSVLYPPADPRKAVVSGANNLIMIIFAIIGITDLAFSVFFTFKNISSNFQEA